MTEKDTICGMEINLKKAETIESRFADIINYCHLGLALFKEREGRTLKYLRENEV